MDTRRETFSLITKHLGAALIRPVERQYHTAQRFLLLAPLYFVRGLTTLPVFTIVPAWSVLVCG